MVKPRRRGGLRSFLQDSCELLLPLHQGVTGQVRLGRLLAGPDTGRLVMLRPLEANTVRRIRPLVERASKIRHPRLLKVLGCAYAEGTHYVASEYIPGVSFLELLPCLGRGATGDIAVAVSVLSDALQGAHAGRRCLEEDYRYHVQRCLFDDAIWVAEYGEAFLTELSVFEALLFEKGVHASAVRGVTLDTPDGGCDDVAAAVSILFRLLAGKNARGATTLSRSSQSNKALARLVTRALSESQGEGFSDASELARALDALPPELRATSDAVSAFMARAVHRTLEVRREQLRLLERSSAVRGDDERTQFHRSSGLRDAHRVSTVPPPRAPTSTSELERQAPAPAPLPKLEPSRVVAIENTTRPATTSPKSGSARPDEDATTLWVRADAQGTGPQKAGGSPAQPESKPRPEAASVDDDATSLYVTSRQPPAEPSVVIQDQDGTDIYLRDENRASLKVFAGSDDPTKLIGPRALRQAQPMRFVLTRIAVFIGLMLLSALLTIVVARLLH